MHRACSAFELDMKTFLGELQSADDLARCAATVQWAATAYPDSALFALCEAELHACQHNLDAGCAVMERILHLPCIAELQALGAVVAHKRGVYSLACLKWLQAAACFESGLEVYRRAGRRSLAPASAMNAALSYLVGGADAEAEAMLAVVASYQQIDKSNWGRQDRNAFRLLARYREAGYQRGRSDVASGGGESVEESPPAASTAQQFALLELGLLMSLGFRCTWWMTDASCDGFREELHALDFRSADERAQRSVILSQMCVHRGRYAEGIAVSGLALEEAGALSEAAVSLGLGPLLQCLTAQLHGALGQPHKAEQALKAAEAYGKGYLWVRVPWPAYESCIGHWRTHRWRAALPTI